MKRFEYDENTEGNAEMQKNAKLFCYKYNQVSPENEAELFSLLNENLGFIGNASKINQPFHCDMAKNISIGNNTFINYNCTMLDMTDIKIGDRVLIGPNVTITTATHSICASERINGKGYALSVTIEDDVWIGANVVILPGVKLGKGCIIAAGAVVNKDVSDYTVVGGVPAKKISISS